MACFTQHVFKGHSFNTVLQLCVCVYEYEGEGPRSASVIFLSCSYIVSLKIIFTILILCMGAWASAYKCRCQQRLKPVPSLGLVVQEVIVELPSSSRSWALVLENSPCSLLWRHLSSSRLASEVMSLAGPGHYRFFCCCLTSAWVTDLSLSKFRWMLALSQVLLLVWQTHYQLSRLQSPDLICFYG